jgi:isocitrate dehydrogenase kinase/phosphatase
MSRELWEKLPEREVAFLFMKIGWSGPAKLEKYKSYPYYTFIHNSIAQYIWAIELLIFDFF